MDALNDQPEPTTDASREPITSTEPAPGPGDVAIATDAPAPEPGVAAVVAPATPFAGTRRRRTLRRFAAAFVFGILGVLAISAGALAAFDASNTGRILPGIHVGAVDLSGLTPAEARLRLNDGYASLQDGELTLVADDATQAITFASIGRRLDVDVIVDQAMAVGRGGATLERIASNVRNMVRGIEIAPLATFERAALRLEILELAAKANRAPLSASVVLTGEEFVVSDASNGRSTDLDTAFAAATTLLGDVDAPSTLRVTVPLDVVEPEVTTAEATAARDVAAKIAVDVKLVDGAESWVFPGATIRGWITFAMMADGGFSPIISRAGLEAGLADITAEVARTAVVASFLVGSGDTVVGVTKATNGRVLDVPGTVKTLAELVEQRAKGLTVSQVPISATIIEPQLTTEEATKTAPLMEPLGKGWTTYFPIGIKNGQGKNIWIPARDIDGYVVLPGATFDFWKAIGPVTREHGYTDGGAIINGKTEPQGALAGGICSCSTTLFNAAARAGLQLGARRNHYYYIDRYPLGLDATVFQSSSGSVQTMSFVNDTEYPILIRGSGWAVGSKGYVKFVLWSVPTGRQVSFSTPIVKNIKPATDTIQYTTRLAPGVRERIEYPVDGKDVWVTRTVKDAAGNVIHQETFYSHYARITGIVEVGIAPAPAPTPSPTP
jgi:vancomycin resistance protein YoaR